MNSRLLKILVIAQVLILMVQGSFAIPSSAFQLPSDSVQTAPKPTGNLSLVNRFSTGSVFFFTGVLMNGQPAFDTKINYNYKGWNGMLFKSFELNEKSPAMNYALLVFSKRIDLSKRLMVSPQIGTQLNQNGALADNTSDILTNLAIAYKLTGRLTLSNDAVFQNLVYTHRPNWTNRLRLLYQHPAFSAAALVWDRNSIFNNPGYTAVGVDLGYNGLKLSQNMNLLLGAQTVSVLRADTPRESGVIFYIGLGI